MKQRVFRGMALLQLFALSLPGGLAGCATLTEAEFRTPTIAVLVNSTSVEADSRGFVWDVRKDEEATEQQFASCVGQASSSVGVTARVITGTQFRAAVFPDLDPRASPRGLEALRSLIPDPRFRARIEAARIDYIAIVGGETRTSEMKGGIACVGGFGAGACFGHLWRDHESKLSALVIDLRRGSENEAHEINASGSSWFAMLAILPLGAPSGHEASACRRFGHAVAESVRELHRRDNEFPDAPRTGGPE